METMWTFETANFRVTWEVEPSQWPDLSWDDDGEVRAKLDSGEFVAFDSVVRVVHKPTGAEVGFDSLGESIYANPSEFRDHIGIAAKSRADGRNYGSYFSGMVREAICAARKSMTAIQGTRIHA